MMLVLTGCSVHSELTTSHSSKKPDLQAREVGLVVKPLVADLDVVNDRKSVIYKVDLTLPNSTINDNAMKMFLETYGCDYIVDPKFVKKTVVNNSKTSEIEITLSGFPAKFKKIYQVDSIPKSVMQYSSLILPVKTVDYVSSYSSDVTGGNIGMEFLYGKDYLGAQFDIAKNIKKLHYFLSYENFSFNGESVSLNYFSPNSQTAVNKSSTQNSIFMISGGVFLEKEIKRNFKIRGLVGVNYSKLIFEKSIISYQDETSIDGLINYGLKVGGVIDYSFIKGFSIVGRANSNLNFTNQLIESGNASVLKYENVKIDKFPLVNFSVGVRYSF